MRGSSGDRRGALPRPTERIRLGRSGLEVSPYCLGPTTHRDTFCEAFDRGFNFFFLTADMHWPRYERARRALRRLCQRRKSIREEIVVAGVLYVSEPQFSRLPLAELVEAMPEVGHLDMAVMGGLFRHHLPARLAPYERHRAERYCGIRTIGAVAHGSEVALDVAPIVDLIFTHYAPASLDARSTLFPRLRPRSPPLFDLNCTRGLLSPERVTALGLDDSYWRPQWADAFRFAFTPRAISGIHLRIDTPRQLDELLSGLERGPLSKDDQTYLIQLAQLDQGLLRLDRSGSS